MCLFYSHTSSLNIDYILCFYTSSFNNSQATLAIFFLVLGSIAKSAQFFFHSWLPDAIEGPTPVSALLHSATIVTAGVYLLLRFSDLISVIPLLQFFISCIGVFTAFYAALVSTTVLDSKKSTAYTTLGQLGFIFYAVGSLAFTTAIFHLFIHGFYKSFSFLENAIELSNIDDEQDGSINSLFSSAIDSIYDFFGFLVFLSVNALPLSSPSVSKELIVFNAIDSASLFFSFFFFSLLFIGFMDSCYDDSSFEYSNSITYMDSGLVYVSSFPMMFSYFTLGTLAILLIFFTEDIFINLSFFWGDFYNIFITKNGSFFLLLPFFATLITTFFLPSNRMFSTSTYDFKLLSTNLFYYDYLISEFSSKFFFSFSFLFFKNFDRGVLEFLFIKPFSFPDVLFSNNKSVFNFFSKFLIGLVFTFVV
jgi:NADH:ubiquinone oxidoreductase subunit 5 (subunit L)/multisubunit Na+/H+ antiporter MnhA subunit